MKGAASINSVATAEDNKYYWDSFDLNEGGAEQDNTSHQAGSQSHLPQAMPLLSGNHVGTGQQVGHLAIIFKCRLFLFLETFSWNKQNQVLQQPASQKQS